MLNPAFIGGTVLVIALSYLLGSFNFAIIVSRVLAKDDVRKHGSGNAGMTNVLRTYGKVPAAITAAGDFLKAVAAVFLSRMLFQYFGIHRVDAGYISGLFVILGHVYPLYFGFRGGKGVMTALGVILILNPLVFLIIALVFVPLVFITKIVSIASILGAVSYPALTFALLRLQGLPALFETAFAVFYMTIILIMHRQNIKRILNGTEHRFGSKKT